MPLVMFIETETTLNPATLKFLPGQQVMAVGTREFTDEEEAEASPLADALFSLGDVTGVFFGRDFVSVTAGPGVDWSALKRQVVASAARSFRFGRAAVRRPDASGIASRPRTTTLAKIPPMPISSPRSRN